MAFQFKKLAVQDIICIEPDIHRDERGYFLETYKLTEFQKIGIDKSFIQVNHSKSTKGTLRGLHYQKDPMAQEKLISVVEGEIFDVGVDIRKGSPTYGQWAGMILDAEKKNMLYIPGGFAHGFCVLSDQAQVIYYSTEVYSPDDERSILWNDPEINISWPVKDPILSERDQAASSLREADNSYQFSS